MRIQLALCLALTISPALSLQLTPSAVAAVPAPTPATADSPPAAQTDPDLPPARAIWLSPELIAHPAAGQTSARLLSSPNASLGAANPLVESFELTAAGSVAEHPEWLKQYPYLRDYACFKLPKLSPAQQQTLLQSQLQLELSGPDTSSLTALQVAPMLDQTLAYDGPLGVEIDARQRPTLRLWAPTAQRVRLMLTDASLTKTESLEMQRGPQGTWQITGGANWRNQFYQYEVTVYSPWTGKIETNRVTDPYSSSLSLNSTHSQIVDLQASWLQPKNWETLLQTYPVQKTSPLEQVVYELHVRDFSATDASVPERHRGKYTAFGLPSQGMKHLKSLAASGLTHVHLLPVFDIATVPEDPSQQQSPVIPEAAPDSEAQQAAVGKLRAHDAFNWGYDPYHYGVPEGSYSTHPHGPQRIMEFRQMVSNLAQAGLGVIMDVVYNHTHTWGQADKSVLDKIVPGYYYRLSAEGQIQESTCCPDTATEHHMMERLMVDTLVRWARDYKVTGFRFDLMGHHTRTNLQRVRAALDQLTLAQDGIDGTKIHLYGEGWKFGSLDAIRPDLAMHQQNSAGTGIGTFNDRFRDSARGGNYDHGTRSDQGFINGLYLDPNQSPANTDTPADAAAQKAQLLNYTDNLRLGLAGNLRDFRFTDAQGRQISGAELPYRGAPPAGYTLSPTENVNYVSAHDNYSLWDQIAAKAPFQTPQRGTASPSERAAMQQLGLALVLLGQGMPFVHAGSEILRSKSGDGDSYDSGDWFNQLDWTYTDNGWGKGLPAAWRNEKEWDFWRPRLREPALGAGQAEILETLAQFQRLLQVRRDSPLFRLGSAEQVKKRVRFLNAERGPQQIPGLIAMLLDDRLPGLPELDPKRHHILVLFHAGAGSQRFEHPLLQGPWEPHPLWQQSLKLQGKAQPPRPQGQLLPGGAIELPPRSITILQVPQAISHDLTPP